MRSHHALLVGRRQTDHRPQPWRSAAPFAGLALAALSLETTRAWKLGLIAFLAFGAAASLSAWSEHRSLDRERATADAALLRTPPGRLPPLLAWRAAEVVEPRFRERVAGDLRRAVHAARPTSLPGASPLDRPGARRTTAQLLAIADRLEGLDPVDARGVLLARALVRDASAPLFVHADPGDVDRAVHHAAAALHVGASHGVAR